MWTDTLSFSVDWVNVTVDYPYIRSFVDMLSDACGLDRNAWIYSDDGLHFYSNSYRYAPAGFSSIVLSYNLLNDGKVPVDTSVIKQHGIHVSISGDGCRYLDSYSKDGLRSFLQVCSKYPHNCTRIDTAMDIFDKTNPIVPLFQRFAVDAYNREPGHVTIKSNIRRQNGYVVMMPVYDPDVGDYVSNVYIGNRKTTGSCVVYNKKIEVTTGRLSKMKDMIFDSVGCTDYWYRIEYRANTHPLANAVFDAAVSSGAMAAFYFLADNLFVFVDQIYDMNNLCKCPVDLDWQEFLEFLGSSELNVHFVQLTSTPYVSADVYKSAVYYKRCVMMVYKLLMLQQYQPDYYQYLVDLSRHKVDTLDDPAHIQAFMDQLKNLNPGELFKLVS